MSGYQISPFGTPNILYKGISGAGAIENRRNDLLADEAQQQIGSADTEMAARIAQSLVTLGDDAKAAQLFPGMIAEAQGRGFLRHLGSSPVWPGMERARVVAALGTPSEKLGERGLAGQDAAGFGQRWGAAGGAPGAATGGGAPMAPAPPGAYGQGGRGSSVTVPPAYMPFYQEASQRTGIPVEVLIAQHRQESGFNPNATGAAGEIGIGQIHPNTARNPGYGMTGVDPATLRDPRTNINFAADYLRARGGGGNWADPEHQRRALAAYNGGGDPNYVTNVTRYLPAGYGGAPATRTAAAAPPPQRVTTADPETGLPVLTGGPPAAPQTPAGGGRVQVASITPTTMTDATPASVTPPAALPPAEATKQAQSSGQPVPIAGVDGLWALPNGSITAQPPARPAQQPPATTQQPPQPPQVTIPPPPRLLANKLTAEQNAEIPALQEAVRRGQMKAPEADAKLLAYQKENVAAQRQYQLDLQAQQNAAATAAHQAETLRISQSQEKRAQTVQDAKDKAAAAAAAAPEFTGEGPEMQRQHILRYGDPFSPGFHQAWAGEKTSRTTISPTGLVSTPSMSEFRVPLDKDGNPRTDLGEVKIRPGPSAAGIEAARVATVDHEKITSAIDHFTDTFKQQGGGSFDAWIDNPKSVPAQQINGAFTAMITTLRSPTYFNTGVLQPAEHAMLLSEGLSPKSWRGLFATPEAMVARLGEIKRAITVAKNVSRRVAGMEEEPDKAGPAAPTKEILYGPDAKKIVQ